MVKGDAISDLFSQFSPVSKAKLLILGSLGVSFESLMDRLRSLNFEHVSPASLLAQEISRRTPLGLKTQQALQRGQPLSEIATTSLMRRWFWTRKPDAGFALTGFPATLLQAKVFDEWLDTRTEALDGVVTRQPRSDPLVEHYRTLGLLVEVPRSLTDDSD